MTCLKCKERYLGKEQFCSVDGMRLVSDPIPALDPTPVSDLGPTPLLQLLYSRRAQVIAIVSIVVCTIVVVIIGVVSDRLFGREAWRSARASATPDYASVEDTSTLGPKPVQLSFNGKVICVDRYLRRTLNNYDDAEYVEWSPVSEVRYEGQPYWGVRLKLRARNAFGGKILKNTYYYIRHNEVIHAEGLNN
jgi:hypothetical protein